MKPGTNEPPDPFRLPLHNVAEAQALVRKIEDLLAARQLTMRPPPPLPTACCGRGCNGCVWQGYFDALVYWRDQARALVG
ncbi:MAG: oxidoreductase [Candidatus Accumulibacter sp.]|nr:oxidoreductase [Accumulibacter sp.]MCB1968035.1 oxidoreductase [Accumulibacter sp.]